MAQSPLVRPLRQAAQKTNEVLSDATEMAEDYFEEYLGDTRDWLQKNSGKALGGLAVVAVVGLLGYFYIQKNRRD